MNIIKVSTNFTRPADTTAYASGDLVANSTTAGSVTPLAFQLPRGAVAAKIWRVGILRSSTSITNAAFRLHIYKDSPTVANGDNGALSSITAGYEGFIDVATPGLAFSDDAKNHGVYVNNSVFAPMFVSVDANAKLYGLLEARAAYTPASAEVFTVDMVGEAYS